MVDSDKARIEALVILDRFANELGKVKTFKLNVAVSRDSGAREERAGGVCDNEFRTIMFKNAPRADDSCLILEKGAWV